MAITFLINLNENEFKHFLKETISEIFNEQSFRQSNEENKILDVKKAADYLNLKLSTLYEKTSQKIIPHFKKGNKLYFDKSELDQWISTGKVKTILDIEIDAVNHIKKNNNKSNHN